jgi:hypothetical protein
VTAWGVLAKPNQNKMANRCAMRQQPQSKTGSAIAAHALRDQQDPDRPGTGRCGCTQPYQLSLPECIKPRSRASCLSLPASLVRPLSFHIAVCLYMCAHYDRCHPSNPPPPGALTLSPT